MDCSKVTGMVSTTDEERCNMLTLAAVPILALSIGLLQLSAPRPELPRYQVEWENDALRVVRVILAPASMQRPSPRRVR